MDYYSLFNPKWLEGDYQLEAVAYYYRTWHGFEMVNSHTHNRVEIMLVLRAHCEVIVGSEIVQLSKGDFIVIDAGVPHKLKVGKDVACRMINIEFKFTKVKDCPLSFRQMVSADRCLASLIEEKFRYLVLKGSDQVEHVLKVLLQEYDNDNDLSNMYRQALYYQLFVQISRLWKAKNVTNNSVSTGYIHTAITFIQQHYDQEIRIGALAQTMNIHENYLQRLFKEITQISLVKYITNVRMEKAKMLLEKTDISIKEICEYVGINSSQYFSKLFRVYCGQTPKQYRESIDKP